MIFYSVFQREYRLPVINFPEQIQFSTWIITFCYQCPVVHIRTVSVNKVYKCMSKQWKSQLPRDIRFSRISGHSTSIHVWFQNLHNSLHFRKGNKKVWQKKNRCKKSVNTCGLCWSSLISFYIESCQLDFKQIILIMVFWTETACGFL